MGDADADVTVLDELICPTCGTSDWNIFLNTSGWRRDSLGWTDEHRYYTNYGEDSEETNSDLESIECANGHPLGADEQLLYDAIVERWQNS